MTNATAGENILLQTGLLRKETGKMISLFSEKMRKEEYLTTEYTEKHGVLVRSLYLSPCPLCPPWFYSLIYYMKEAL
jgi:hypothetical protein